MDIRVLAIVLLIGHLISAGFMVSVIRRQVGLFKMPVQKDVAKIRKFLFALAIGVLLGNFIPIIIDLLTIFNTVKRSTNHVNIVGIAYSLSNALVFALSALLIWLMYRMAASIVLITEHDKSVALAEAHKNE